MQIRLFFDDTKQTFSLFSIVSKSFSCTLLSFDARLDQLASKSFFLFFHLENPTGRANRPCEQSTSSSSFIHSFFFFFLSRPCWFMPDCVNQVNFPIERLTDSHFTIWKSTYFNFITLSLSIRSNVVEVKNWKASNSSWLYVS